MEGVREREGEEEEEKVVEEVEKKEKSKPFNKRMQQTDTEFKKMDD